MLVVLALGSVKRIMKSIAGIGRDKRNSAYRHRLSAQQQTRLADRSLRIL